MKAIGYLGKIEKLLGVPATTRSWNTIQKVVQILVSRLTKDHTEHTVKLRIELLRAKQYNRRETHQFRYAAHTSC